MTQPPKTTNTPLPYRHRGRIRKQATAIARRQQKQGTLTPRNKTHTCNKSKIVAKKTKHNTGPHTGTPHISPPKIEAKKTNDG